MSPLEYWIECVQQAADECGAVLTQDQLNRIADAVMGCHDNYGMAFYSPPATDRIAVIERECKAKVEAAEAKAEQIRSDFVANVCMRHGCSKSDVMLEGGGHVTIGTFR
jgi:hypothetical protein